MEEDEDLPQQNLSYQMSTVEGKKKSAGNIIFPKSVFSNPETDERVDGGKIRGLAEGLKRQQERGSEMKDILFLFKVLSFEQRVQGARMDESVVYPSVRIWTWTLQYGGLSPQGNGNIRTSDRVLFMHSLFDTFLCKRFQFTQGETLC